MRKILFLFIPFGCDSHVLWLEMSLEADIYMEGVSLQHATIIFSDNMYIPPVLHLRAPAGDLSGSYLQIRESLRVYDKDTTELCHTLRASSVSFKRARAFAPIVIKWIIFVWGKIRFSARIYLSHERQWWSSQCNSLLTSLLVIRARVLLLALLPRHIRSEQKASLCFTQYD